MVIDPQLLTQVQTHLGGVTVFLVGMMGCGKSTTGKRLASRLSYHFCDTDQLIAQVTGLGIAELFAQEGEAGFRRLESQVLAQVASHTRLVVATGGGVVTQPLNWSYLHHGVVVWLDAPLEVLVTRLSQRQDRPLVAQESHDPEQLRQRLQELYAQRRQCYAQADVRVTITPGMTVGGVTKAIVRGIVGNTHPRSESIPKLLE
ncbi:shikimate kinase domain protein [Gloeomargarita lithophora Alchichica-D10]|uniref:Shikimate kinase n=1 Tax=Gloeomargarita lithophora Alchichica-D10 TaxID=1188229 RepID=A0A1J0AH00_9CYAN|nr:shikimate kinase [Gloeomargarita lithophora]APB35205.1 shikimate kinase domain protein [Gloeomargarita lithophora Alchichica-D10]